MRCMLTVCKQGKANKPPEAQAEKQPAGKKDKKVCFSFKLLLKETFACYVLLLAVGVVLYAGLGY